MFFLYKLSFSIRMIGIIIIIVELLNALFLYFNKDQNSINIYVSEYYSVKKVTHF